MKLKIISIFLCEKTPRTWARGSAWESGTSSLRSQWSKGTGGPKVFVRKNDYSYINGSPFYLLRVPGISPTAVLILRTESKFLSFFLFILFFLKQGQNQELSIQKYAALASFLCWLLKCFLMSNFISCNLIPTEQIKEVWRRAVYYSNSHSKSAFKLILYITLKLIQLVDA